MRLRNRSALVTGAGSGIGRAIARRLAAEGAFVACAGRAKERCEETVALVEQDGGRGAAFACDVTDQESVRSFVEAVVRGQGAIHIVVNNAGAGGANSLSGEDDSRWHAIVDTNLTGLYHVTKAALPRMPDNSGGRFVNVSSVLGRFGVPGYTAYCASKHGVIGFTKALAHEVARRGITANSICPGWVETEMAVRGMRLGADATGTTYEEFRRRALDAVPIGRILEPEEIAGLAAYLCSDEASGVTGQAIGINGGSTMD